MVYLFLALLLKKTAPILVACYMICKIKYKTHFTQSKEEKRSIVIISQLIIEVALQLHLNNIEQDRNKYNKTKVFFIFRDFFKKVLLYAYEYFKNRLTTPICLSDP